MLLALPSHGHGKEERTEAFALLAHELTTLRRFLQNDIIGI